MKLNLKRPIIFFDLETTGVDTSRDRIVEISMIKVMPDGEEITRTRRLNPGMPIPAEATAVHGITDDDVRDCPSFAQVAKSLAEFVRGCDFGGFNSNRFDLPVRYGEAGLRKQRLPRVQRHQDSITEQYSTHMFPPFCFVNTFSFGSIYEFWENVKALRIARICPIFPYIAVYWQSTRNNRQIFCAQNVQNIERRQFQKC